MAIIINKTTFLNAIPFFLSRKKWFVLILSWLVSAQLQLIIILLIWQMSLYFFLKKCFRSIFMAKKIAIKIVQWNFCNRLLLQSLLSSNFIMFPFEKLDICQNSWDEISIWKF